MSAHVEKNVGDAVAGAPKRVRRWGVWLAEPRFMVTVGRGRHGRRRARVAVAARVSHGQRVGHSGRLLEAGEQPLEALRRELREEIGVELDAAELVSVRTLRRPQQVEIHFRCRVRDGASAAPRSMEINRVGWFDAAALPPELSRDQRRIIADAHRGGANAAQ
jgi:8-oxo-dGTP pyrophosphatase MutT (NUDIX family)